MSRDSGVTGECGRGKQGEERKGKGELGDVPNRR